MCSVSNSMNEPQFWNLGPWSRCKGAISNSALVCVEVRTRKLTATIFTFYQESEPKMRKQNV